MNKYAAIISVLSVILLLAACTSYAQCPDNLCEVGDDCADCVGGLVNTTEIEERDECPYDYPWSDQGYDDWPYCMDDDSCMCYNLSVDEDNFYMLPDDDTEYYFYPDDQEESDIGWCDIRYPEKMEIKLYNPDGDLVNTTTIDDIDGCEKSTENKEEDDKSVTVGVTNCEYVILAQSLSDCSKEGQYKVKIKLTFSDRGPADITYEESFLIEDNEDFELYYDDESMLCNCYLSEDGWDEHYALGDDIEFTDCDPDSDGKQWSCCCGDDANEIIRICEDGVGEGTRCNPTEHPYVPPNEGPPPSWPLGEQTENITACCLSEDFCVFNGQCFYDGYVHSIMGICDSGKWMDSTPPDVSYSYDYKDVWTNGTPAITITAESDYSFITGIRYCWGPDCNTSTSLTSFPSEPGQLEFSAQLTFSGNIDDVLRFDAVNEVGINSTVESVSVKVDNSDPETSCVGCIGEGEKMGAEFGVSLFVEEIITDDYDTVYCLEKDDTPCTGFMEYPDGTIPIGNDCQGTGAVCTYTLMYYSTDVAGNAEGIKENRDMIIDTNRPSCTITTPLDQYSNTRSVHLEWECHDPMGDTPESYVIYAQESTDNGIHWTVVDSSEKGPTETEHTFELTSDGLYGFYCRAFYERLPAETEIISAVLPTKVDTADPLIEISTPAYTNTEDIMITWTASDEPSGLDHFTLEVNGDMIDSDIPGSERSISYTGASGSSYDIEMVAYDRAGNPSLPSTSTVTVDTEAPDCSMIPLGEYVNTLEFDVQWSSTADDVAAYDVCIKTSDSEQCTTPSPLWEGLTETTKPFTGSHTQTYYFRCRATDHAGNTGEWSSPASTTIDSKGPELDEEYNNTVIGSEGEDMTVNVVVTDDSGIDDVELMIGGESIDEESKTGSVGDTEWTMAWVIPYDTYAGHTNFSITARDINGNTETRVFTFSVYDCLPGQVKECHPRDIENDKLYNLGVCAKSATKTCRADGTWSECTGGILPTAEKCDGLDNDCDGQVDENLAKQECGFSNVGLCRLGFKECVNGVWSECEGERMPEAQETCGNGWDDDCDGSIDEDCSCEEGTSQPCGQSGTGICRLGVQTCSGGSWGACMGAILPETEICDGLDNDCDGEVDEDCDSEFETTEPSGGEFPWWILSVIGAVVLVAMAVLWYRFRKEGEELTWENLKKRYTPEGG